MEIMHYKDGLPEGSYEHEHCAAWVFPPEKTSAGGAPVLLWFHGGGLEGGSPEDSEPLRWLCGQGVLIIAAKYRLYPHVRYPDFLTDAAAAFFWARCNAARFGGDPARIYCGGHSAGGYLCTQLVLDPAHLAAHGLSSADVAGVMPISGQMVTHHAVRNERGISGYKAVVDEAAPIWHIRPGLPRFLNVWGDCDIENRGAENIFFALLMRQAGNDCADYEIPDRDHGTVLFNALQEGDPVRELVRAFIR